MRGKAYVESAKQKFYGRSGAKRQMGAPASPAGAGDRFGVGTARASRHSNA